MGADRDLLAPIKEALREFDRQGTKLAGSGSRLREILWPEEVELVENAPEWLGVLVQAVEDQQQEIAGLRADGQRLRDALEEIADGEESDAMRKARAALASPRNE